MQRYVVFTSIEYDPDGYPTTIYGVFQVPPCFSPNDAFLERAELLEVDVHLADGELPRPDGTDFSAWAYTGGARMWDLLSVGPDRQN